MIVIHGIASSPGQFGGSWIDALFTSRLDPSAHPYFQTIASFRVSARLLIRRDGELIQYVSFHRKTWRAGVSEYAGRSRCNDFSIGIELEGADDIAYDDRQYPALATVILALWQTYPAMTPERLIGHADIAPGRQDRSVLLLIGCGCANYWSSGAGSESGSWLIRHG